MTFEADVRREWPTIADSLLAVIRSGEELYETPESVAHLKTLKYEPTLSELKLENLRRLMGGYDVLDISDGCSRLPDLEYICLGETYKTTIMLDRMNGNKWRVGSWGSWIEHEETQGNVYE